MLTSCAVIGSPVAHSLSPAIHRAAYADLGLDWSYTAIEVPGGQLPAFVASLDESVRGLSVTAPHKADLVALGEPDDLVGLTGAANTWVRSAGVRGRPIVRNTDVPGYGIAFAAHGITALESATIIGNGATACSALVGVARLGVSRCTVLARAPERAQPLVELAARLKIRLEVDKLGRAQPSSDVLISTVPARGLAQYYPSLGHAAAIVFDSVYDPWPTPLAVTATAAGRVVLNGLDLLAGQAVEQVRWHTGGEVSFALLRQTAQDAADTRG